MTSEKYNKGYALFREIHGGLTAEKMVGNLVNIAPEIDKFTMEWIFSDLYSDNTIDMKTREIINISALIATGAFPQLRNHIHSALKLGLTESEIKSIIMNTVIIVGFPSVVNSLMILNEIIFDKKMQS